MSRGLLRRSTKLACQDWKQVFAGIECISTAILDRVMHHNHTAVIEGTSYRMKDAARLAQETS